MKNRVTGIGGIFFKTQDAKATKNWYKKHLGFDTDDWGCTFWWKNKEGKDCSTQWSPFDKESTYFEPSKKEFMLNYRVENLKELLEELKKEGVTIIGEIKEYDYGKFGWILDNEKNKIELWEPKDQYLIPEENEETEDTIESKEIFSAMSKEAKETLDAIKEKATEFATDTKEVLDNTKEKVNKTLSSKKVKETIDSTKKKVAELAEEAGEHIADFAEETKEEIEEATKKTKSFLQRIFNKKNQK